MNMKTINIKIATFSFAAMLLASCSDSGSSGDAIIDNVGKATTIVGSNVTAEYANQLASRVLNYKGAHLGTSTKTRALATRADAAEPTVPAGTPNLSSITNKWENHPGIYVVPAGETLKADGYNIAGMTIYVKGTLEYEGAYGSGASINVLSGGKLIARKNSSEVFNDTKVSNYGTIEFPANQKEYIIKNTFYQYAGDLNIEGHDLNLQGGETTLFVKNSLIANKVSIIGKAQLYVTNNVTLKEGFYMTNQTEAWVNNVLTATSLKLDEHSTLHSGCAIKVDGDVYATNGTNLYIMYLKAKTYRQDSNAILHLQNQSMVDIEGKYVNLNNGQGNADLEEKDGVAVIKANALYYNAPGKEGNWNEPKTVNCSIFKTSGDNAHIIVDTNVIYGNEWTTTPITDDNTTIIWNDHANVHFKDDSEAQNYVIKKTECNPNGYNDNDNPSKPEEPTKEPTLDLISSIEYNHDHDISATCIQVLNDKLYMSYHTRDKNHGGCVEVFSPVTNNKVTLDQYLCDEQKDLDFNHLLATQLNSGKRMVYLPGSSFKKGAMLAYIPIQDNKLLADKSMSITSTVNGKDTVIYEKPLQFIQMNPATGAYKGYDENCVVYNDKTNHLIVATTKGYLVYNADTYNEIDKVSKPGKVKHIAIGNGKIVTVHLDREATSETEAIPATVEIFDQQAEDMSNPLKTFAISTIEPNNGKNVVRIDDNKIYVCRGAAGMYVYDMDGNELWHYQMPTPTITEGVNAGKYKGHANGCYVGKKYVYIAYGGFGLVILDKETHKVIAHRAVSKSANYVIEHNGYIYVAYGQKRLQVFQLKNADPEISY